MKALDGVKDIFDRLDKEFPEHLERVRDFLKMRSVSYTGEGIRETAEFVRSRIESLGGKTRLIETPGRHPIVYGKMDEGADCTLLIYSMYDTKPAGEPDWISPPFEAEIHDVLDFGPCVIARGAVNTKGPTMGFFNALGAFKAARGKLPVNLVFMIEGEEEMGSVALQAYINAHPEEFADCDAMFFPCFGEENGVPLIGMGVKGCQAFELVARGGAWGGPKEYAIHSAFAAWVGSPSWRLVKALGTLVGEDETDIRVKGFYDGIIPYSDADMAALEASAELLDEEKWKRMYKIDRFKWPEHGIALWKRLFNSPTININGLVAGFLGEGTNTILPHEAVAKFDVRLLPGMSGDAVCAKIRAHLDAQGFADIELRRGSKYFRPSKVSFHSSVVQTLKAMYEDMGRKPQIWPLNPGSAPYSLFGEVLRIPYVTGGLGHGSRQHASNEYCTVKGVLDFEKSMVYYLSRFPEMFAKYGRTV